MGLADAVKRLSEDFNKPSLDADQYGAGLVEQFQHIGFRKIDEEPVVGNQLLTWDRGLRLFGEAKCTPDTVTGLQSYAASVMELKFVPTPKNGTYVEIHRYAVIGTKQGDSEIAWEDTAADGEYCGTQTMPPDAADEEIAQWILDNASAEIKAALTALAQQDTAPAKKSPSVQL